MDFQTFIDGIGTVGFPIVCVFGLAFFAWKYLDRIAEANIKRETKLYEIITDNQAQMKDLSDTNTQFMEVLKQYKDELKDIREDVQDIKMQISKGDK